ncbi:MAG: diacylglycerol kinase family lipid kinase [Cytophagales bacterium]|nr:diacylglycerol kinase family lipid kinase [Cytophagales bacterium]MDW8384937.1 diacylglycerol kinase family lipid kinase [Flammeovirgaceae bacterium]
MKELLFIVNPVSGTIQKKQIVEKIKRWLHKVPFEIIFTQYPGHATQIAQRAVEKKISKIVAVGGDGTVNEVARALIHSSSTLGILPVGSGNGLARHLKIPMKLQGALNLILHGKPVSIDVGYVNERPFFCTSGLGFDALVSYYFDKATSRGLLNYAKITVREYLKAKETTFQVHENGVTYTLEALMLTFANASQYGNNVYISPKANISDGFLDFCCFKKANFWQIPSVVWDTVNKTIHQNPLLRIQQVKQVSVETPKETFVHIDGDYINLNTCQYNYRVQPCGLQVIAGS